MLQRFEELLFHDGQAVFLKPDSKVESAKDIEQPAPPQRVFHNLHDAAAWIQKNWPDFDLEANHAVIWRGEP